MVYSHKLTISLETLSHQYMPPFMKDIKQFLSEKSLSFDESITLATARKIREKINKGFTIFNLTLGEPSEGPPPIVLEYAKKLLDNNIINFYPPVDGFDEVKEIICEKLRIENNIEYTPDWIMVSTGAKQSIANILLSTVNKGDGVLLIAPYWVTYATLIQMIGATPIIIKTEDIPKLPSLYDFSKIKLIILNSPRNPDGKVFSEHEIKIFIDILLKNENVLMISDEIYEYFIYSGKHISPLHFQKAKERIFLVNGISKSFGMTGWRIGYVACHPLFKNALRAMQGQFTSGPCAFAQKVASFAIAQGKKIVQNRICQYKEKKECAVKLLSTLPQISLHIPEGAFYILIDLSKIIKEKKLTEEDLSNIFIEKGVGVVEGSPFGAPNHFRISFSPSPEIVEEGVSLLVKTLQELL